jgi:hypothetical protein
MRAAVFSDGPGRGVYVAPWVGPKGELVLLAIRHDHRLAGDPYTIPNGANQALAADALWERLEREDPPPTLRII